MHFSSMPQGLVPQNRKIAETQDFLKIRMYLRPIFGNLHDLKTNPKSSFGGNTYLFRRVLVVFVIVLTVLSRCESFGNYRKLIPNGGRVPDPCNADYLWQSVGHEDHELGGRRNAFGRDFDASLRVSTGTTAGIVLLRSYIPGSSVLRDVTLRKHAHAIYRDLFQKEN